MRVRVRVCASLPAGRGLRRVRRLDFTRYVTLVLQDAAFDAGAVQLVVLEGSGSYPQTTPQTDHLANQTANLMFYPPRPTEEGGLTGEGRVLVCSNLHWCGM